MNTIKNGVYTIRTPENIELRLTLAGLGDRTLAHMIDTIIIAAAWLSLWILGAILLALGVTGGLDSASITGFISAWALAVLLVFTTGLSLGYYLYFEIYWQGQTPGKRWANLRVIRSDGRPLDLQAALIRNILRIVDQSFLYLGLFFVIIDPGERRLGDRAAGTLVIKETARENRFQALEPEELGERALNINRLKPQDYLYLTEFLERRRAMEPQARIQVAALLAQRYATLLNETAPRDTEAELFLQRICENYQRG